MPCAVTQPTKPTTKANTLERSTLKRSIHKALVRFFTCPPHTPLCSPIAPTTGQTAVAWCNAPLNASRLLATTTATSTHWWSASMARNALLSPKAFPTSTPVNAALSRPSTTLRERIGCSPQPWKVLNTAPSKLSRPSPSSVAVWLPAKWEGDVMAWLACMPENCKGMHRDPMMGSGRLPEGRLFSNNEVSMSHGHLRQDLDYQACQLVPAWSMQCERRASAQEAAQWSPDASVSLTIVHD